MEKQLHILNGDAMLHGFNGTGLGGDVLVWREILSEGPVTEDISSAAFWEARGKWISESFNEPAESYKIKVIDEIGKLSCPYSQITLWFEFDLHCQINLLGALNLLRLQSNLSEPAIYLVCPAEYPGKPDFKGLGELNGSELDYLYDSIRVQLTDYDLTLAAEAWAAYCTAEAEKIEAFITGTPFWANLPLLKPSFEAHLKRLQTNSRGLNYIEQQLLDIYNSGKTTKPDIYAAFWAQNNIYGLGDTAIDLYLNKLQQKGLISF
ncbi:DUF1835 domain-containing protein [Mucilaginibacter sp. UR6-1]|uniref:DUF1835 domain-containing protein n=1 Tax=Mucilaginibacter sp. UR6-1 TaxID=1435643 RepID=UPI001E408156|nr:DUF1835 domain-containing protein [Mucilaginibacter sp. UR6-1]MCC8410734.1 DUF1835 domain-containing protein [Mucilaginibacter sp. UR6-1]